jgi:hypothetical protein
MNNVTNFEDWKQKVIQDGRWEQVQRNFWELIVKEGNEISARKSAAARKIRNEKIKRDYLPKKKG